jgi:hypothetical protein
MLGKIMDSRSEFLFLTYPKPKILSRTSYSFSLLGWILDKVAVIIKNYFSTIIHALDGKQKPKQIE